MSSNSLHFCALSDVGLKRKLNEDSILALKLAESSHSHFRGVFAVADGMGGHEKGDLASQLAIRLIYALFKTSEQYTQYCQAQNIKPEALESNLKKYFQVIHHSVKNKGKELLGATQDTTMGTTLSLAIVQEETLIWGHIGDSRIYLLRAHKLKQLTEDHTLVAEQLKRGEITEEELKHSKEKNVLTQAIGASDDLNIHSGKIQLEPNDMLLLCSDGLHGLVSNPTILECMTTQPQPEAANQLIEKAKQAGGSDNISVILVQYEPTQYEKPLMPSADTQDLPKVKMANNAYKNGLFWLLIALLVCLFVLLMFTLNSYTLDTQAQNYGERQMANSHSSISIGGSYEFI